MKKNRPKPGDWKAQCHVSGQFGYASQLVKRWDGVYVLPEYNDPRHPQELTGKVPSTKTPPWSQPENKTD